jgi:hypothetical protein
VPRQVAGGSKYKPPVSDINAPDLYLPLMGFLTYCLLCCVADVVSVPNRFKPEVPAVCSAPRLPICIRRSLRLALTLLLVTRHRGSRASPGGAAWHGAARCCSSGRA